RLIGELSNAIADQNACYEVLNAGDEVFALPESEVAQFHLNEDRKLQLEYLSNLDLKQHKVTIKRIFAQLNKLIPSENLILLEMIEKNIEWETVFAS
ncbi:MAG TPA: hypothetical protein V6C96_00295, partial [Vampirovibrionales bacterium]